MRIGAHDSEKEVLVIAEIGNNHEGSYSLAEELIGLAAQAGAQAVKFQTIVPRLLASSEDPGRIAQLEKFSLSYAQYEKLAQVAAKEGVLFLSTPFDLESARFLDQLVPAFKIASGDNDFYALIDCVAATGKPILLSTGMAGMDLIRTALDRIRRTPSQAGSARQVALLHCVSSYPTPPEQANLRAISALAREPGITAGYSDHTLGIEAAVLSVALGARIIEKHFTRDKQHSDFHDHRISADPRELRLLVERVREAEAMLGSGTKIPQAAEMATREKARRSVAAARTLEAGALIGWEDITWLRPAGGFPPGSEGEVVGRRAAKRIPQGHRILREHLD